MTETKVTADAIRAMKGRARIASLTAYDFPMTRLLDEATWRERMARARACMADADEEYAADAEAWDATSGDRWTDATR